MEERKKILFILPAGTGGAQRMSVTIAKMLPIDRFDVKFVIIGKERGFIEEYIPKGYSVSYIYIRHILDFVTLRLYNIIRKVKPYKVFCSIQYLNPRCILAAKMAGVKSIIRSSNSFVYYRMDIALMIKFFYPFADCLIAQQDEMRKQMIEKTGVKPNKVVVLQNVLDRETIDLMVKDCENPYKESNQIKYVWTARFAHQKGQDILLKAFEIVKTKIPAAHLYLVGKYDLATEYGAEIKNYVSKSVYTDSIHLVGFDKNPYKWMKYADCFVLPSRFEGLPNALIEASYLNKPLVASNCIPVISKIVKDGVNGYIAESEKPESLAQAMVKAISLRNCPLVYCGSSKEEYISVFE